MASEFLHELQARGFLHQSTDLIELDRYLNHTANATAYIGFDATAPSLHVGSLVPIMLLRLFAKHGHHPIVLLGGATTKIGDPSGKDETRQLLEINQIEENAKGIARVFTQFMGGLPHTLVNNQDWLDQLNYIDMLREYGRHFSVNRMLSFENVKRRLEREQNLSFIEFNYMILQSIDFVELYHRYGCRLQMGGSDQWGNIISGLELGQKLGLPSFGAITTPLITTASGVKMGKTAQGAVWLTADRLSPYDYWQFWRNTADSDVVRFLKLFTDIPVAEIERLSHLQGQELNQAKIILADAATALAHGSEVLPEIHRAVEQLFGANNDRKFDPDSCPRYELEALRLQTGLSLADLVHLAGGAASKGEARRLIRNGGVSLNDQVIMEELYSITVQDFVNHQLKLSVGKKRHWLVILT